MMQQLSKSLLSAAWTRISTRPIHSQTAGKLSTHKKPSKQCISKLHSSYYTYTEKITITIQNNHSNRTIEM